MLQRMPFVKLILDYILALQKDFTYTAEWAQFSSGFEGAEIFKLRT